MAALGLDDFNRQVQDIIRSMEEEGMVDGLFGRIHELKESNGPLFFASLLPTFSRDSTVTLRDLTVSLDQPVLNYHLLNQLIIKIKGSACSIGASRFTLACSELGRVIETETSKERHITALNAAKRELLLLQEKMNTIVQLEMRIANETDCRRP